MHATRVIRILPYRPGQLFDLIADVEAYPEFLPWVSSVRTWNHTEPKDGIRSVDAEARVGFSIVRETFATRVFGLVFAMESLLANLSDLADRIAEVAGQAAPSAAAGVTEAETLEP